VLFVLHLKSVKSDILVRPICSSLISLKRVLFLLDKIISTSLACSVVVLVLSCSACLVFRRRISGPFEATKTRGAGLNVTKRPATLSKQEEGNARQELTRSNRGNTKWPTRKQRLDA